MKEIVAWILLNRILSACIALAFALVSFILAYIISEDFRNKVNFWWLGIKCNIKRWFFVNESYIKEVDKQSDGEAKWYQGETKLCEEYYSFYGKIKADPNYYSACIDYLTKIKEQGRKPLGFFLWLVIILLVVVEALGFSYVLAGYTIPGASERVQQYGAVGIAFVISIILVYLTHASGGELYANSLKENMFRGGDPGKLAENSTNITLGTNDHADDNEKNNQQMYNRLGTDTDKKLVITTLTAIFIVVIAICATYVRGQVLEKQLNQEITTMSVNAYETEPADMAQGQMDADNKALLEQQEADRKAGWMTFIVLAILFTFIQILGMILGYKHTFAGNESLKAYKATHKFKTLKDYLDNCKKRRDDIISVADIKLKALQQKIHNKFFKGKAKDTNIREVALRTFDNYIIEKQEKIRQEEASEAAKNLQHNIKMKDISTAQEIAGQSTAVNNDKNPSIAVKDDGQNLAQNNDKKIKVKTKQIEKKKQKILELQEQGFKDDSDEIAEIEVEIEELEEQLASLNNGEQNA